MPARRGGTVTADAVADVPIADDVAAFGGGFVMTADHAWAVVCEAIRTRTPEGPGEWCEL